jgi:hypothetical protein
LKQYKGQTGWVGLHFAYNFVKRQSTHARARRRWPLAEQDIWTIGDVLEEATVMSYLKELQDVIWNLYGVASRHAESVPVKETFQGETVWEGVVEVFELTGHPKASRAYAWSHDTGDPDEPKRHVTLLHIAPVLSATMAVRAAIRDEFRTDQLEKSKR